MKILLLLLLVASSVPGAAQVNTEKTPRPPAFIRCDGPPLPDIPTRITEDRDGRIFLTPAGKNGVFVAQENKRVVYRARTMRPGAALLPDGTECAPQLTDQFGNQWALTRKQSEAAWAGIAVLPAHAPDRWVMLGETAGLPAGAWTHLAGDVLGYIWAAGEAGVVRYDPRQPGATWAAVPATAEFPGGQATALGVSPSGLALVALASGGLYELDMQPKGKTIVRKVESTGLPDAPVRGIYTDAQGTVWAVAGKTVYSRDATPDAWQRHWKSLARLPHGDHDIFSVALNGRMYVPTGMAAYGFPAVYTNFDRMFIYEAGDDQWSQTPPMSVRRCYSGVAELDGKIWVVGGGVDIAGKRTPTDLVEIFDPATAQWRKGPSLDTGRMESVVVRAGSRIYVLGGVSVRGKETSVVSIGQGEGTWRTESPAPMPLSQCAGCVQDGIIYVMLGGKGLLSFDPAKGVWRTDHAVLPNNKPPRAALVAAHNGEVWVMGGQDTDQPFSTWRYAPRTDTWRAGPSLPYNLCWGGATDVNGRLILTGGASYNAPHRTYTFWNTTYELREESAR